MITRWRIEAEGYDREQVEDALNGLEQNILHYLNGKQEDDKWELTDDPVMPIESQGGEAVIYGRRVFRRMDDA